MPYLTPEEHILVRKDAERAFATMTDSEKHGISLGLFPLKVCQDAGYDPHTQDVKAKQLNHQFIVCLMALSRQPKPATTS